MKDLVIRFHNDKLPAYLNDILSTGAIESLPVKVDGDEYQVQDLAQINRKNPKTIVMKMDSFPQAIPAVLEALTKSGMDLNPQQDGTTIFIPVPK